MKRSVRDYLLTLVMALVVFAIAAFFLVGFAESIMNGVAENVNSDSPSKKAEETGADPQNETAEGEQKDKIVTFLIYGIDGVKKDADAIFLVGINETRRCMTVSLIPSNTVVMVNDTRFEVGKTFGSKGEGFLHSFVKDETGINADYYAAVSMDGLSNVIDFLGGISFSVPQDMVYYDSVTNLRINLKAGQKTLTGDEVVQLLSYRGYENGKEGREDTQLSFARAFCTAFLKPENLARFKEIMYNALYNIETDFSSADLDRWGATVCNFSSYAVTFNRVPGSEGSDGTYSISSSRAATMFEAYQ